VLDGQNRKVAAEIGAMDRQTLRDWVHRFNEKGPRGSSMAKLPGRSPSCRLSRSESEPTRQRRLRHRIRPA
jgi:hypothetical protein